MTKILKKLTNFCAKIGVINRSNLGQSNLFLEVLRNLRFLRTKNILNVVNIPPKYKSFIVNEHFYY
ncbi:hypothetical protein BpHYR1_049829 [Brachionus plicatilis]|uniref:Uncharacterized protein n=1 Tax=Brachionus plicatilis TaxID=10195 RepID=A0A3M7SG97_BRAPC|nr:hypothetical protein BpHYR1_049829 [Brachionus plicatilis]